MNYPLSTLAPTITATGISAPSYVDILESLKASYRLIYGSDVNLASDTQDGQYLAIVARAIHDSNGATLAVYNAFSPSTAQGVGLSSVVKINGIERLVPSKSTADVTIGGTAGTIIENGVVSDVFGNRWDLPSTVTIPVEGEVIVTASAQQEGAISAAAASITSISTPTLGWQTVTNVLAATQGAPVESDATLRRRQAISTSLPAISVLDTIIGAVANLAGVQRYRGYENDTGTTDADGIPGHTIAIVAEGGDAVQIATAIALKKTPGTGTYGTTSEVIVDQEGVPNTIRFYRPTEKRILVALTITALPGYVSTTGVAIKQAIADYVNSLAIGVDVYRTKLIGASDLGNGALGATYNVTALTLAIHPAGLGTSDLVIAFNEAAGLDVADIALTVS